MKVYMGLGGEVREGDTRPGGSGERLGEEEKEGEQRNKKRKLDSHTDTESDTGIDAVRENLAKVQNFII